MKIKSFRYILASAIVISAAAAVTSCKDDISDSLRSEAKIENFNFTVTGVGVNPEKAAPVFRTRFSEDGDTIYIRVPEDYDVKGELNGAKPTFYLSMGATVSPAMTEPQDFSDPDNPVVYTVTSADGTNVHKYYVTYVIIPPIPVAYGVGFTEGKKLAFKTFSELGFPGAYGSWAGGNVSVNHGDVMGFPAFCGNNHIVVFSRRFAWGDDGSSGGDAVTPNAAHAFKVFDTHTLTPAGSLNLGGIAPADVVAIASDWGGNMVAAVGRKNSGKTDFYCWTSPSENPVLIGTADVSVDISAHAADASPYINIAGDITGAAVIAGSAPHDVDGSHYKFTVAGGKLVPGYTVIKTGHTALDKNCYQMISFFGAEDSSPYLVGDTKPNGTEDNGQIQIYLNNPDGTNRGTMDYHCTDVNGWKMDSKVGDTWWSRSGKWLNRDGARRPTVHAMVINGKPYSYWTTGTDWGPRGVLMDQDLTDGVDLQPLGGIDNPYPHWCYGRDTGAKRPSGDEGIDIAASFGAIADWYFDEEETTGYVALWADRMGLIVFQLTCFEL